MNLIFFTIKFKDLEIHLFGYFAKRLFNYTQTFGSKY